MAEDDKVLLILEGEIKTPPMSSAARIEAGFLLRRLQRGDALYRCQISGRIVTNSE